MENHHCYWENSLYMAMFNSYVKLPEGIPYLNYVIPSSVTPFFLAVTPQRRSFYLYPAGLYIEPSTIVICSSVHQINNIQSIVFSFVCFCFEKTDRPKLCFSLFKQVYMSLVSLSLQIHTL